MAVRGQKLLLLLANRNLHLGRLGIVGWQDMFLAAEAQLDFHPVPRSAVPGLFRYEGHNCMSTEPVPRSCLPALAGAYIT